MFSARRAHLSTLFLTLVIDVIGFSLIFPLFPAILDYYFRAESGPSCIEPVLSFLKGLALHGPVDSNFLLTVLFGGCMAAIYSFLQFIFSPIWGSLSDKIGRRPVVLISISGTAVGYLIWVFSGSFVLLFLSRIITGSMSANMAVATAAVADLTTQKNRAKGMALVGIAFGLGIILGPMIGGLSSKLNLLELYPEWHLWGINPFSISALIALGLTLLNFFWVLCFFGETRPQYMPTHSIIQTPWQRILSFIHAHNPRVRHASWVNFFFILAFSGMEFSLIFLAKERLGFSPAQNGLLFAYIGTLMIVAQGVLVRRLASRLGEKHLCLIGLILGIFGFIDLAFAHSFFSFFLGAGIMAIASGLMNALVALTSLYSSSHRQGQDMGIFRSAASLGRSIGPMIAAIIYFWAGALSAYLLGALILLLPLTLGYRLPQPEKSPSPNK